MCLQVKMKKMDETEKIYHQTQRTEEVQQIIERMPTRFGLWITIIVLCLFSLLFFLVIKSAILM